MGWKLVCRLAAQHFDAHYGQYGKQQDHQDLAEVVESWQYGQPE